MIIDQEMIGAFVDGELDEVSRRRIEVAIAANPVLAQQVEAERRLRAVLHARFDPVAEAQVPERLVAAVREGAKVVPLGAARRFALPQWAAIAATLVAGLFAGHQLQPQRDIEGRGGAIIASGKLATALETQLASNQEPGAVRIGLTFKDRNADWCRTFQQGATEGIACRSSVGWEMRRTMQGGHQGSDYRQAASSSAAAAAQEMAAGEPLDSRQEAAVVKAGWR